MVRQSRQFSTFIGVDLGGGKGKNTAVARLEEDGDGARVVYVNTKAPDGRPFYDAALVEYVRSLAPASLLAVDAPLLPSVCLRCQQLRCPGLESCQDPVVRWFQQQAEKIGQQQGRKPPFTAYTQRACEVVLKQRYGILPRETLGQGMGPLTSRAHYLRRALEEHYVLNENLIEVYPKATVHVLFGAQAARRYKREVNTWATRAQILEALSGELRFEIWREGCLKNDHCFDALICAYTGYLWSRQGWTLADRDRAIFEQDGWIWFPPAPEEDEA